MAVQNDRRAGERQTSQIAIAVRGGKGPDKKHQPIHQSDTSWHSLKRETGKRVVSLLSVNSSPEDRFLEQCVSLHSSLEETQSFHM